MSNTPLLLLSYFISILVIYFEIPKIFFMVFDPEPYHILPEFGGPESKNQRWTLIMHHWTAIIHIFFMQSFAMGYNSDFSFAISSHVIFSLAILPNILHLGDVDSPTALGINLAVLFVSTIFMYTWTTAKRENLERFHLGFLKSQAPYILTISLPVFINLFGFVMYLNYTKQWIAGSVILGAIILTPFLILPRQEKRD